ncbi:hypothetical protein E2R65_18620 [Mucilaginibacter phyllosphaerae]|uniref:Uncharacterized protein n=1 Tax=Mucilaginibacter phyllosphaerae TaxID=1812349 RepID=A0A4Y8A5U8_9SPHI|nr:hypothetical protein [Mucilaginibacter phyllosphaerae]MBB3971042.1 hypothetical protein [Mucilaginibacter phyllosphaerae]TEW63783.1 hypothetical protein E2R65_18620 [Mucilaginibacter phyllosphaerae]GGH22134.1 hypothetical protein GCM10007352_35250 [Mucilaginibacter phyllosphaerae]
MLKASSLYIVIIISFIIALICSSLIAAAYFYRLNYQKKFRSDKLQNNLESGINLLLSESETPYRETEKVNLFNNDADSVITGKLPWGVFDIGTVRAFIQQDTLQKSFMIAKNIDSANWMALYLIDEDRPLSVSGQTLIRGNVRIPKAGIRAAYVDGKAYKGDPKFVDGHIYNSEREIPAFGKQRLEQLNNAFSDTSRSSPFPIGDSLVKNSFFKPTLLLKTDGKSVIKNMEIKDNIVLYADTTLYIDSTARLDHIMIFARSVVFGQGFKGNCQVFARDSVVVGKGSVFTYPSCIGLLPEPGRKTGISPKLSIGEATRFEGIVFYYEKEKPTIPTIISFGKKDKITGQIYVQGTVSLKDSVEISGSITCQKFLYQSNSSSYENFLINTRISAKALSPYYLTSDLLPVTGRKKKILLWLERN